MPTQPDLFSFVLEHVHKSNVINFVDDQFIHVRIKSQEDGVQCMLMSSADLVENRPPFIIHKSKSEALRWFDLAVSRLTQLAEDQK